MLFNGQVPAPMIRVRQGDTINLTITNSDNATHPHNVDFHAAYGPGGGSEATLVGPGQTKYLRFKQYIRERLYITVLFQISIITSVPVCMA